MRKLFADKYNSFFHFLFGILSFKLRIVIPFFIIYQLLETMYFYSLGKIDENVVIDLIEFFIGYSCSIILYHIIV
jgi:hypothetical protein